MKTTLLIMAAGIGSRFGTGIKQLEPVDDANHIIMDYSIHDAIEAGFNHVVFIIRKDIEKEFKEVIGERIASICSAHNVTVDYAFQDINDIPRELPAGRTKPWGTGQAVLAAKDVIKTPFIVINADDLFRTLLNRNLWLNPLSDVMGGWGIWETVNGEQKLTTECIENVIMMIPFSAVVMWTFGEKIGNGWKKILCNSGKIAFIFSISIEMLQLLLRLGTFQLSDIFYNTVGGMIGGLMYCAVMKARKRL